MMQFYFRGWYRPMLFMSGACLLLAIAFFAGAATVVHFTKKSAHRQKPTLPSAEFFATADAEALLKNHTEHAAWEYATSDELLTRLDILQERISHDSKSTTGSAHTDLSFYLIFRWRDALGELALRPGFRQEAIRRFAAAVRVNQLAFDEALFCRLAWMELENRLMNSAMPEDPWAKRDADTLWREASRIADALLQESEQRRAALKSTPSSRIKWEPPPAEKNFNRSETIKTDACGLLLGESRLNCQNIKEWQWGHWCGTGSEGFYAVRTLALLLAAERVKDTAVIREELAELPWIPLVAFDRDPISQEIRVNRILDAVARRSGTDLDSEWLGRILATRRSEIHYCAVFGETGERLASRGGDALAGALLRLLESQAHPKNKKSTDKEATDALRILSRDEIHDTTIKSVRFDTRIGPSRMGYSEPTVTIERVDGGYSCGSSKMIQQLRKPYRSISDTMRQNIFAKIPLESPDDKR